MQVITPDKNKIHNEPEPSIFLLMNQNQAYSCLCERTKHTHAYVIEPSILMLMNQKQAYSCLIVPQLGSSYYLFRLEVTIGAATATSAKA